jgi:ABC-type transport system involved in Fe-S cluster assembly fused permease/ATPase subunit
MIDYRPSFRNRRRADVSSADFLKGSDTMGLIVAYFITLIVTQSISIGVGLAVDRYYSSYGGLMVFIAMYFLMFWVSWQIALRVTAPKDASKSA